MNHGSEETFHSNHKSAAKWRCWEWLGEVRVQILNQAARANVKQTAAPMEIESMYVCVVGAYANKMHISCAQLSPHLHLGANLFIICIVRSAAPRCTRETRRFNQYVDTFGGLNTHRRRCSRLHATRWEVTQNINGVLSFAEKFQSS